MEKRINEATCLLLLRLYQGELKKQEQADQKLLGLYKERLRSTLSLLDKSTQGVYEEHLQFIESEVSDLNKTLDSSSVVIRPQYIEEESSGD